MPTGHPDPPERWRLVCICESAGREDHANQRPKVYEGPSKHVVFGLAKRAGWRLSSRWKTAHCPECTGGNGAHGHQQRLNKPRKRKP